MSRIGFIGLGHMGLPMAVNLVRAGHEVMGFDLAPAAVQAAREQDIRVVERQSDAVEAAEVVITMLPEGRHVRAAYDGGDGILALAAPATLLIDCSTIDVATARALHADAAAKGLPMLDAPVSGGVGGAVAGTLTFMVGGEAATFEAARPLLACMGKTLVHAGGPGTGQAAKICNNMMLGIQMISVAEAFGLAERLGLDAAKLFEISSRSSGQCWSLTSYCPVPGLVPGTASERGYAPGFTVAMMLKDLGLAQTAAGSVGAATPLGVEAHRLYQQFAGEGQEALDFSAIILMIAGKRA